MTPMRTLAITLFALALTCHLQSGRYPKLGRVALLLVAAGLVAVALALEHV